MLEKIKNGLNSLGEKVGVSGMVVGIAIIALVVLIIAIVVIAIVSHSKKSKKKPQTVATPTTKAEEKQPSQQAAQTETKTVIEKKPDQPAENQTETKELNMAKDVEKTPEIKQKAQVQAVSTEQKETKPQKKTAEKAVTPAEKAPAKQAKRMLGKWRIVVKGESAYIAALYASNGEVMLTSEIYSTEDGARNGVETIRRGVETGAFVIYRGKGGDYYFKLKSAGNRLLCVGEIYTTRDACEKAAESVKRIAKDSPVLDEVTEGERFIEYRPGEVIAPAKKNQGKWRIEQGENGFSAKLYANNGQLMLATEEVASKKTAEKAIDSVRKNCAAGNFYIDQDKFGRFYYKLHNTQKSVICTGETYDKVDSVVSAIESVRRFASNAELTD